MDIDIRTTDPDLAPSLFGMVKPKSGDRITLDQGVQITLRGMSRSQGMMEAPIDILSLAVSISTGIATGILANWLWSHIKDG